MSDTKPLTVAQLLVLTTAAQRPGHMVLPLPPTIRARGGAQRTLLGTLLKRALVAEMPVDDTTITWRSTEAGPPLGLRLTATGLAAAGLPTDAAPQESASLASTAAPPLRHPAGKLGDVLLAISADAGATLAEITALTGWLPHTARAAVTGLRRRGFAIQLILQRDRKAYRLTEAG